VIVAMPSQTLPGNKKGGTTMLPREIQNELKMTVALKGFAQMREGKGKKVQDQLIWMERFFQE
jgi:hypothetical protein